MTTNCIYKLNIDELFPDFSHLESREGGSQYRPERLSKPDAHHQWAFNKNSNQNSNVTKLFVFFHSIYLLI